MSNPTGVVLTKNNAIRISVLVKSAQLHIRFRKILHEAGNSLQKTHNIFFFTLTSCLTRIIKIN